MNTVLLAIIATVAIAFAVREIVRETNNVIDRRKFEKEVRRMQQEWNDLV